MLRLFHVAHVTQNKRYVLSLTWHERFSCKDEGFTAESSQISRRLFVDYVKKNAPKSVWHVQHEYLSSFNQSYHWFVALSSLFPSSCALNSLTTFPSSWYELHSEYQRLLTCSTAFRYSLWICICLIIKACWLVFYAGPRYIWARLDYHQVCIPSKENITWAIFAKINTGIRDPHSHDLLPVLGTMFERGRGKQRSGGEGLFFQHPLFHVYGLNLADISILSWGKSRLDHTEQ